MGIDVNGTRCLLHAKRLGVDFARMATIGRQSLLLNHHDLAGCLRDFGHASDEALLNAILTSNAGYAEGLFKHLGAEVVHSLDHSSYEGATHLHDMNQPLPEELAGRYSTVLDGGSLEHVFNFPVAIKNAMEMVAVDGHYLGITPANNFLGHGFYQFSPELFFSVFTPDNGFKILRLLAFEDCPGTTYYAVKNPREVRERVTLHNRRPVYLFIIARKIATTPIFATMPQQSDYVATWQRHAAIQQEITAGTPTDQTPLGHLKARIPNSLKHAIKVAVRHPSVTRKSGFDPRFFEAVDITQ